MFAEYIAAALERAIYKTLEGEEENANYTGISIQINSLT